MTRILFPALVLCILCSGCVTTSPKPVKERLRHVVLFKFKEGTSAAQVKAIEERFSQLPSQIPQIVDFEWGTDCSVEGLANGFTHCFFVTFDDAKGRETYLPHPAHQSFVDLLKPSLDKVLVIDYIAR